MQPSDEYQRENTSAEAPGNLPVGEGVPFATREHEQPVGARREGEPVQVARRIPTIPQLATALGILVAVFGVSYLPLTTPEPEQVPAAVPEARERAPQTSPYEGMALTARAAYVWDVREQRALYEKNAGLELPLASLTKLMTALVAYETLGEDALVEITTEAIRQEGDHGLLSGEYFSLDELAALTLLTSSNDGAYALAAAAAGMPASGTPTAFISAMNERALELGLTQTTFLNPTGLDLDEDTSGSYGSVRDITHLMEYLLVERPDVLAATRESTDVLRDTLGNHFHATNTNELAEKIPGLLGSKTGFTDLAGGNLVVALDAGLNRPIIIAVLGSTREGRFEDVAELIERTTGTLAAE